ncbi:hypothetical protein BAA37_24095 [Salmonella enterica subsp. enterica serovar Cubana]|nr:hypothetical protein [Salmonella enterica]ECA8898436.1 hypothetical protein [Salmonella enterica subsp. enterica serovar Cubana]ECS4106679.1 hypothetical protein [Salmonella enterica subsp. enterica serovar Cubana]ECU6685238.1 hypothetical protein [Salmonella enterica subsp. enterica serovar Cubana]EED8085083.1 hypothetical protein [Salmonella enterica subsp. enterica serovar Kentucky]
MKATVRRYLRAAGSILDISPSARYTRHVRKTSDMQEIGKDFYRIGGDFRRAIVIANATKQESTH